VLSNHLQNICIVVGYFVVVVIVIFRLETFERQHNAGLSSAMDDIIALTRKCTWGANQSRIPSSTFLWRQLFLCLKGIGLIGSLLVWKLKEGLDNGFMIIYYFIVQLCHLPKRTDFFPYTIFTEKCVILSKWHRWTTKYKLGITVVHICHIQYVL